MNLSQAGATGGRQGELFVGRFCAGTLLHVGSLESAGALGSFSWLGMDAGLGRHAEDESDDALLERAQQRYVSKEAPQVAGVERAKKLR